jgi:zinc transport system ATP-binding protein
MSRLSVLELRDVTIIRDRASVLSGIMLEVAPSTVHLLVGPNGAGKSTLFGAVLGLIEFSGSIRFHWRRSGRIGYVPQSFAVDRTLPLTVGEFLALSRQHRPVCFGVGRSMRTRLQQVLGRVGLGDFLRRPLGALSGGELQKVLLANAIDPAPELLLLDEPASGLDETAVRQFEDIVVTLRERAGTSVLMVSHDFGQVRRIADRVTLIDKTVRRTGTPDRVLTDTLARALATDGGYVAP